MEETVTGLVSKIQKGLRNLLTDEHIIQSINKSVITRKYQWLKKQWKGAECLSHQETELRLLSQGDCDPENNRGQQVWVVRSPYYTQLSSKGNYMTAVENAVKAPFKLKYHYCVIQHHFWVHSRKKAYKRDTCIPVYCYTAYKSWVIESAWVPFLFINRCVD